MRFFNVINVNISCRLGFLVWVYAYKLFSLRLPYPFVSNESLELLWENGISGFFLS